MSERFDSILVVSFGGPEGPDDVLPFLENVTRGRGVPRERLAKVAEHYQHFGGKSPINARTRELVAALEAELSLHGPALPVYFGNRFWHPFLTETIAKMAADGRRSALAFVTSAFSSYSSCRAYLDDIAEARAEVGVSAPTVQKIRPFFNHPGYVETCAHRLREAIDALSIEERARAHVFLTAHSIPVAMAEQCAYRAELDELAGLVAGHVGVDRARVVFQSRSGSPEVPWLEPDVCDAITELASREPDAVVVAAPFGFVADHMEVVWDLDVEAREVAASLGIKFVRAGAANAHPRFVQMVRELITERIDDTSERLALGALGARPDVCPPGCCPSGRPPRTP